MNNVFEQLTGTEFDAVSFAAAGRAGVPYHDQTARVESIIGQFLRPDWFARLLRASIQIRIEARTPPQCRVLTSRSDAEHMREELARLCLRGFAVVLVVSQPPAALRRLLEECGYVAGDRAVLGSNEPGDALEIVSASDPIVHCLGALDLNQDESAILFAHDADPVYLIEKSAPAR